MLCCIYMICEMLQIPNGKSRWPLYQCQVCRRAIEIRSGKTIEEVLQKFPPCGDNPPSPELPDFRQYDVQQTQAGAERLGITWDDAKHYAAAISRWAAAGFPVREQAEVEQIESELCQPCEHYRDGRCKRCGCQVTQSRIALINKIKMATEKCPIGKW